MVELNKTNLKDYQMDLNGLEHLKEEWREKQAKLEYDNEDLLKRIEQLSNELGESKEQFKTLAVEEYAKTDSKQLIGGLGIRVSTDLTYTEDNAFRWAKEHDLCLQLNKREFEKVAKTQEIDFVIKGEKITVTFPKVIKFEEELK